MSIDWLLTALVIALVVNWVAVLLWLRLAHRKPRIAALSERTTLAIASTLFITLYTLLIVLDRNGSDLLDLATRHNLIRVGVIAIGLYPLYPLYLFARNKFRDGNG